MASTEGSTIHASQSPPVASPMRMCTYICVILLATFICPAQDDKLPIDEGGSTFGVTVVSSSWLKGDIYLLNEGDSRLPNFKKLKSIGSIYTPALNIPARNFLDGFPGITDRSEWFAIDYHGRFWIPTPGKYRFTLQSDDGAKLYIDSKTIISNDGIHAPSFKTGDASLSEGTHTIRISYFQGPRYQISLILAIAEPGQKYYHIFNIEKYQPPAEKYKDVFQDQMLHVNSEKKSD
jgi:hypothetical protein